MRFLFEVAASLFDMISSSFSLCLVSLFTFELTQVSVMIPGIPLVPTDTSFMYLTLCTAWVCLQRAKAST